MPAVIVAKNPPARKRGEADYAYELRRLHACLDSHGRTLAAVAEVVDEVRGELVSLKGDVGDVHIKVAFMEGRQSMIATRVGVTADDDKEVKTAPLFGKLKWDARTIAAVVGIVAGLPTLYLVMSTVGASVGQALLGLAH